MPTDNRKMLSSGAVYLCSSILTQLVNLLLIPLYTRNLSQEQFGQYDLIISVQMLLSLMITLGVHSGMVRFFNEFENKRELRNTALTFALLWGAVCIGGAWILSPLVSPLVFDAAEGSGLYIPYVVMISVFSCLNLIYSSFYSMQFKALKSSAIQFAVVLSTLLFALYFFLSRDMGIVGILTAQLFSNVLVFIVLFALNLGTYRLIKSPEDTNMPFHIVTIQRTMRLAGLLIAVFLPGFYIALTSYNIEQLPTPLLATIMNSRTGLPLSIPLEAFMMLFLFEVFHEAGIRLPKSVGQTITVVGGLIVGDSAIRAGITSPTMVVMVAVTIIATFTLVNQVLAGTTSIVRLYVLTLSSLLGMFGFFIALFSLVLHLATLECYGVPYLAPISPYVSRDVWEGLMRKPVRNMFRRPKVLRTQDPTRKGR